MDGIDVADSQLSIEKLSEVFGIDLFKDLDKRQKALSESMRIMIEEQFYWILVQDRYDVLNFGRNLNIRSSDKAKAKEIKIKTLNSFKVYLPERRTVEEIRPVHG